MKNTEDQQVSENKNLEEKINNSTKNKEASENIKEGIHNNIKEEIFSQIGNIEDEISNSTEDKESSEMEENNMDDEQESQDEKEVEIWDLEKYVPKQKLLRLQKLFDGYKFKFEGMINETLEKSFTKVVEDLGAKVTKNAILTLTDVDYFLQPENIKRRDLIGLAFIEISIEEEQLLDIEDFRFSNFTDLLLREKEKAKINSEIKNKENLYANSREGGSKTNGEYISQENMEDLNEKKNKKNSNIELTSPKTSQNNNLSQSNTEWIDVKSSTDNLAQKSKRLPARSSESELDFDSDVEENEFNRKKYWWKRHDIPAHLQCKKNPCTFLPFPHESHLDHTTSHQMLMIEKKIILMFLIEYNCIELSKGRKVYQEMRKRGYLTHRSEETLRNCFRRSILEQLEQYELPQHIKHELEEIRDTNKG